MDTRHVQFNVSLARALTHSCGCRGQLLSTHMALMREASSSGVNELAHSLLSFGRELLLQQDLVVLCFSGGLDSYCIATCLAAATTAAASGNKLLLVHLQADTDLLRQCERVMPLLKEAQERWLQDDRNVTFFQERHPSVACLWIDPTEASRCWTQECLNQYADWARELPESCRFARKATGIADVALRDVALGAALEWYVTQPGAGRSGRPRVLLCCGAAPQLWRTAEARAACHEKDDYATEKEALEAWLQQRYGGAADVTVLQPLNMPAFLQHCQGNDKRKTHPEHLGMQLLAQFSTNHPPSSSFAKLVSWNKTSLLHMLAAAALNSTPEEQRAKRVARVARVLSTNKGHLALNGSLMSAITSRVLRRARSRSRTFSLAQRVLGAAASGSGEEC